MPSVNSIRCENNPELRFAYTPNVLEPLLVTAMSPSPSLVKSAIAIPAGVLAVGNGEPTAGVNTPVPSFTRSVTSFAD